MTVIAVLSLLLAGCMCLPIDVPLSGYLMDGFLPGELRNVFKRAEAFGHAYGLLGIAVTIFFLDGRWKRRVPRLIFHGLAAGLLADVVKLMVWRTRPRFFDPLSSSSFTGTIFTAKGTDWLQLLDSTQHSFPSAHTAVAVACALTLGRFYPAARGWFVCLAALCAMNRVDGGSHFASDVCWGAALGVAATQYCWQSGRVGRLLDRWERVEDRFSVGENSPPQRQAA
jgi:membrane-associated phospholipid phosphatase